MLGWMSSSQRSLRMLSDSDAVDVVSGVVVLPGSYVGKPLRARAVNKKKETLSPAEQQQQQYQINVKKAHSILGEAECNRLKAQFEATSTRKEQDAILKAVLALGKWLQDHIPDPAYPRKPKSAAAAASSSGSAGAAAPAASL